MSPAKANEIYYLQGLQKFAEMVLENEDRRVFDFWDVITAIRGPDRDSSLKAIQIKDDTTGRVRAWVSVLGDEHVPDKELLESEPKFTRDEVQDVCGAHFTDHLYHAELQIKRHDPDFRLFKEN